MSKKYTQVRTDSPVTTPVTGNEIFVVIQDGVSRGILISELPSSGGSGTVTSVGALSPLFTVANATTTPTFSLIAQNANKVFAGPTTGIDATPTFRVLVAADIPDLSATYLTVSTAASTYQPLDSDLTAIAALSPSNDDIIQRKAGAWTNRTLAQYKSDLSLSGTNTGDQTITLTGEATGTGTGSFAVTLTNSAVIGKVLTGYTSGSGTVSATDTILQAIQKLNGNIAAITGSQWTTTGSDIYYNTGNVMIGAAAAPSSKLHVVETSTATPRGVLVDQYNTGAQGARITMRKSRGTFASPTVIVTADALASWTASGYDGTGFIEAAKILVTSTGTIGTSQVPATMALQTATAAGTLTTGILIDQAQALTFSAYASVGAIHYSGSAGLLTQLVSVAAGSYLRSGGVTTAPVWSTTTLPNSAAVGDILYASATNVYSNLADVAVGSVLISGGVTTAPSWTNNLGLGITSAATRFHIQFASNTTGTGVIWQDSAAVQRLAMLENGSSTWTTAVSGASVIGNTWNTTGTATANGQTKTGFLFNFITTDGAFTGLTSNAFEVTLNSSATRLFSIGSTSLTTNGLATVDFKTSGDQTVRNSTGALFLKGGSGSTTVLKFGPVFASSTNNNVSFNWTGTIHNLATGITRTLTGTLNDCAVTSVDGSTITYIVNNQTPSFSIGNSTMTMTGYNWNPSITGTGTITHYAMLIQSGLVGIGIATPTYQFQVQATLANQSIFSVAENGGTKIIEATEVSGATRLGFFAATPVIQPASANQAAITDSTGGTAGFTLVDVGAIFSQSNVNNNFASINRQLDSFRTALVNLGAIKGAA